MICVKCKKEIPDESVFCLHCGWDQGKTPSSRRPKARGNGQGSVYKLPNGKYRAAVTVVCAVDQCTGKLVRRYRTKTFAKRTDAVNYLADLRRQKTPDLVTLDALYLKFEKTKKYAALSKSQQDKLSYAWARLEPLRYKKISEITLEDMQRTIDEKVSTFYPARDMKTMLSHLYTLAIKHGYVDRNPTEYIELPENEKSRKDAWKQEELRAFWADWQAGNTFTGYILIMIYAGLRFGELPIPKENIHLDEQYMIGGIKTDAGTDRTIPIADIILPVVRYFYDINKRKLLEMNQDNFYRKYWDTIKRIGVRELNPHCCRHTYFTRLASAGIQPGVITAAGGHTSYQTTLGYTHIPLEDLLKAVNKI